MKTVPAGFVATTPAAYSTDLWSRQELVALPGQAMLPPPVPATIDFDDVDATGGPITGAALESYLNQLGITISDITPSGVGEIVDDRFGFPPQVLRAFSDYNVFWHDSANAPCACTLRAPTGSTSPSRKMPSASSVPNCSAQPPPASPSRVGVPAPLTPKEAWWTQSPNPSWRSLVPRTRCPSPEWAGDQRRDSRPHDPQHHRGLEPCAQRQLGSRRAHRSAPRNHRRQRPDVRQRSRGSCRQRGG
jgi:hypothetical protein